MYFALKDAHRIPQRDAEKRRQTAVAAFSFLNS